MIFFSYLSQNVITYNLSSTLKTWQLKKSNDPKKEGYLVIKRTIFHHFWPYINLSSNMSVQILTSYFMSSRKSKSIIFIPITRQGQAFEMSWIPGSSRKYSFWKTITTRKATTTASKIFRIARLIRLEGCKPRVLHDEK